MAIEIKTSEDLQKFLDQNNLKTSAILEGYELAKAKLAKAEADYSALSQAYNKIVEENKKLKEEINAGNPKPRTKKK